jgi:hypothetical protein
LHIISRLLCWMDEKLIWLYTIILPLSNYTYGCFFCFSFLFFSHFFLKKRKRWKHVSRCYFPISSNNGYDLRATSHTKLRACDHCTSSVVIGRKGGAGPSSLHTMLEGPMEYVNARWMQKSTWSLEWHQMNHVSWPLGLFQKPPLGSRPNTRPGDHGTPNAHTCWFILFYHAWWLRMNKNSLK